jgi:cytochrome c peroxidase
MNAIFSRRKHVKTITKNRVLIFLLLLFGGSMVSYPWLTGDSHREAAPSYGNAAIVQANYEKWKSQLRLQGDDGKLALPLAPIRGLSKKYLHARGKFSLNLIDGTLDVVVDGLPPGERFDVWLIDNLPGPGRSVKPERGDTMLRIGQLMAAGATMKMQTQLHQQDVADFKLDLIAIAPAGESPEDSAILFGSPSLFQRLYYSPAGTRLVKLGGEERPATSGFVTAISAPFLTLVPQPAYADDFDASSISRLVKLGERLFFEETFKGNGRTCGTCHPAENNLTLDAKFIATLPRRHALFVAEFVDALNSAKNGGQVFEVPALMRRHALIVENVDGREDLKNKFVARGVPHTFALGIGLNPAPDGTSTAVSERTGWGGDGAPLGGTLRDFAIGAVIQHFPLTLKRELGVDFILPTDEQLDAMEAFQLSLGRQKELSLPISFKAHLDEVIAGQGIFLNDGTTGATVGAGKCNRCHQNAGANINGLNFNFNTGVEAFLRNRIGANPSRPPDGGFGTDQNGGFNNVPNPDGSFGNGTFNTTGLVEAADTPPFFHNNIVNTIEEAVDFYNSNEFNSSPAGGVIVQLTGGGIDLLDFEVEQVAAFLRVLNTLENIRSVIAAANKAVDELRLADTKKVLELAIADCQDAIDVLSRRDANLKTIDGLAVANLQSAKKLLVEAKSTSLKSQRESQIKRALQFARAAQNRLID